MRYFSIACILPYLLQGKKFNTRFELSLFTEVEQAFIRLKEKMMEDFTIVKGETTSGGNGDIQVYTNDSKKYVMKTCIKVHEFFETVEGMESTVINGTVKEYNETHQKSFQEECGDNDIRDSLTIKKILEFIKQQHETRRQSFINEIKVLTHINGRGAEHIPTFTGFILDANEVTHLIYEHAGTDLYEVLRKGIISNEVYGSIMEQMLKAVGAFHDCGFIHNDLKLENFLLDDQGNLTLTDFGSATMKGVLGRGGTTLHVAPERLEEIFKRGPMGSTGAYSTAEYHYGEESDVWSLGVCFHFLLTKRIPFTFLKDDGGFLMRGQSLSFVPSTWRDLPLVKLRLLKDLLQRLLNRNIQERFTVLDALDHDFFKRKGWERMKFEDTSSGREVENSEQAIDDDFPSEHEASFHVQQTSTDDTEVVTNTCTVATDPDVAAGCNCYNFLHLRRRGPRC